MRRDHLEHKGVGTSAASTIGAPRPAFAMIAFGLGHYRHPPDGAVGAVNVVLAVDEAVSGC